MDAATLFDAARQAHRDLRPEILDLVGSVQDSALAIPNSTWRARELAVHLVIGHSAYAEFVTGVPSPFVYESKEQWDELIAAVHADVPETDPAKLASMLADSVELFGAALEGRSGDQPVVLHSGLQMTLAEMSAAYLGEVVLHGYDLACALGTPWSIDPGHAALVLVGYLPIMGLCVSRTAAAAHTARYRLDLRGAGSLAITFADGEYSWGPVDDEPVDCVIDADPVAYLLASSGRVSQWPLISMGLITAGGARPELALGFGDLFVFP